MCVKLLLLGTAFFVSILEKSDATNITKPQKTRITIHPSQASIINEYWCWRTKYCHRTGGVVCGRDRRLNKRRKFKTACDLYSHNCDKGHDFTVTNIKFCKGY
ncbi:uncharacterized protein [Maniola hyperantus]|uniref:uncharacterized protein n=1 Tax=Aphantopus hyperantus TaxID=2795564 RepID=UPI003747C5D4